ncbi:thiolase family protein [Wenjunlia tyrosinilytica]|uniref:Probable acetyl-CoA acetyltransferase n=1 Tax=Wenjunlia tyrosinilytica TaxID=1544741 RepID=A0A917ZW17_9ACTN|nr:thiolase family protein [Wenjunlia tyrosinilytica]GGO97194.1 acetyl-CoA acetyltransferase [Wenjunlia tyrosinilytica]
MSTDSIVVLGAARTPFARFDGALRDVVVPALGGATVAEALRRARVAPEDVDEVAIGVNFPGSDRSLARQIQLRAGIPEDRNSFTVDRACCSSLAALTIARRGLLLGESTVAVAGGAENLGLVPYFLHGMRWGTRLGDVTVVDQLVISCPHTGVPRAVQAAEEAQKYGVGREEQDAWALRSHVRYAEALAKGHLEDELHITSYELPHGGHTGIEADEAHRPQASMETLASLGTVYGSATVTAGNAPGLSTGASALVLSTRQRARAGGHDELAQVLSTAQASGPPANIASIPATAARKALHRAGLGIDDIDLIEINEAFAAVPLVTTLVLGDHDPARARELRTKTNVNGGAIAIGHPTGATAARLVMTAAFELRRRGGGTALVTLCGGVGEAEATVIRVEG